MRILIAEDHPDIRDNIALYLNAKGHTTKVAKNGSEAFGIISRESFDFLILDRMMPEIDGLSLVRMLRARHIDMPFLFLTALGKQTDKIEGLSLGADDYLVKPCDLEELRLRIENIAKRKGSPTSQKEKSSPIEVDEDAHIVKIDGKIVDLSPKEYDILTLLYRSQGTIISRESIYESLWGEEVDLFANTLDTVNVHIAHMRKKLPKDLIRTVKHAGYIIDK